MTAVQPKPPGPWAIDAKGVWEIDRVHFPTPISPWFGEVIREAFPRGFAEGTARLGLLLSHFEHRQVNGFDYLSPRIVGAPAGASKPPPRAIFWLLCRLHPQIRRRLKVAADVFATRPWRDDVKLWETTVRPASTRTHLALGAEDPAAMDDRGLADLLARAKANAHEQYYWHHRFTPSSMVPVGDYLAQASGWTGLGHGELLQAARQPKGVHTVAGAKFAEVAAALADDAAARALLDGEAPAAATVAALEAHPGPVGVALRAYLEMAGLRLVTGYDVTDLTVREMPELLLRTLRAAAAGHAGMELARREELRARVRDQVPDKHRPAYDQLLAEAIFVSNLREERALVCDFWALGIARRALLELGRRLQARGLLDDPSHVFDATVAEQQALLAGTGGPSRAQLAERHAWRTTATADLAPQHLGGAPSAPPPPEWMPPDVQRAMRAVDAAVMGLFHEPAASSEPKIVRGLNASAGTYEGRARVVLRPADFPRIERGDVLIARMTTEAYNGVMPLLGAVVTDRGGLLSHAATVAREFGIPAVVGTLEATRYIPDGARVRVDGTRGEARLV